MPIFELRSFGVPIATIWTDDETKLRASLDDKFGGQSYTLKQRAPDCCDAIPCKCGTPACPVPAE